MDLAIIYTVVPKSTAEVHRISKIVAHEFTKSRISTQIIQGFKEEDKNIFHGINLGDYLIESNSLFETLVFVVSTQNQDLGSLVSKEYKGKVYTIDSFGRLLVKEDSIKERDHPNMNKHIFNILESKEPEGGFYYFPYGYLFRYLGMGPINPFGFRIPENLEPLINRSKEHKVIAVFGGSAAWSMYSTPKETFQHLLGEKLKETSNNFEKVTVLNFGMHGHVVMNEFLSYLIYCSKLKPEIVIAHDGWNDFLYGLLSDNYLLNELNMTYQYNLEVWSQLIHGSFNEKTNQPNFPLKPNNLPHNVLGSYVHRKLQFQQIVESFGGTFIWGLQPSIFSRTKLTSEENQIINSGPGEAMKLAYPRVEQLYTFFSENEKLPIGKHFLNLHDSFMEYGDEEPLFGDYVHTLPAGDERIAEIYARYIINRVSFDRSR